MVFAFLANQPFYVESSPDCPHNDIPVNEANNDTMHCKMTCTFQSCDDNGQHRNLSPTISVQRDVFEDKLYASVPGNADGQDCSQMGWTEKETCIKCDRGGKLLVCSDSGCPLAVHEKCMHCLPQFDDVGNFYCPYCWYKQAILESHKARKKAILAKGILSVFLDKEIINSDQRMQEAKSIKGKKLNSSTIGGHVNQVDSENWLNSDEVHAHLVQIVGDQQGGRIDPENAGRIFPCKGAEETVTAQNNFVLGGYGDNARLDHDQTEIVIEQQKHLEPIIACGNGGMCFREDKTGNQFEAKQVADMVEADHSRQFDCYQHGRIVEDEKQAEALSTCPVDEDPALDCAVHEPTKGELNGAKILMENEGRTAEEREMLEQVKDTNVSSNRENPATMVHAESSDSFCCDIGTTSINWSHVKRKNQTVEHSQNVRRRLARKLNVVHPQNFDTPRGSSRKLSFELNSTAEQNEKNTTTRKSGQFQHPSKSPKSPEFLNMRRKKRLWTEDEEEMLKEGVQKFSSTANKNLPWRKILEFGHHVFDGTRTPVDLKDKWRNMLAKG